MKRALEKYFSKFRNNTIGYNKTFITPFGEKNIIYADWVASGRLYLPIEERLINIIGPFIANTHTETTVTGTMMTKAYHNAHKIIKKHVRVSKDDIIITTGSGMTGCINKFQRILGLKICKKLSKYSSIPDKIKPIVFLTHMEHHSNQTTWLETICDVEVIKPTEEGYVDLNYFKDLCKKYRKREIKIASITACSNVTGIEAPIHEISEIIHKYNGLCFVDYACSAPYVDINMHYNDKSYFDAIFFSPHKFLGGPGSSGVLIFNSKLYKRQIPDHPGGGTVAWTNPWYKHKYFTDIEIREDGGTPPFIQTIKAALSIKLKEKMKTQKILKREDEFLPKVFSELGNIDNIHILQYNITKRLAVISFYIDDLHYNLGVKILNDYYGIQTRGGCSCAGTYGHYLLHVSKKESKKITNKIDNGNLSNKPGWIRLSLHPTMNNEEILYIIDSIKELACNFKDFKKQYIYQNNINEFIHKKENKRSRNSTIKKWFTI